MAQLLHCLTSYGIAYVSVLKILHKLRALNFLLNLLHQSSVLTKF